MYDPEKSSNQSFPITIFYDGKCGLCSKEINYYRKIVPLDRIIWQDIMQSSKDLEIWGISRIEGLKQFHAIDNSGRVYRGIDAFVLIWRLLKGWCLLAKVINLPGIRQLANIGYACFARWRFNRLEHCRLEEQNNKN